MRFEDVTEKSGLAGKDYALAASVADYGGDGRPDLLVSHLHGVTLYRNRGGGVLEDVTKRAGIDDQGRWSVGAAAYVFAAGGAKG